MTEYIELDWEEQFEPLYGSPIIIPPNTLLWRGYDTRYNPIPDEYKYYSGMEIVMEYAKKDYRDLGCFVTTRPLKLLDVRFMSNILERFIHMNQSDKYINDFASCIISFGLCSLGHQILLVKKRYNEEISKNPTSEDSKQIVNNINSMIQYYKPNVLIEQKGIRVAETINDGITMTFLQELFRGHFDGFISPRLNTAFHNEKGGQLNPEMILFSPKRSGLNMLTRYPSNVIVKQISSFIKDKHQLVDLRMIKSGERISMKMYVSGGNRGNKIKQNANEHHLDRFEDILHSNNKNVKRLKDYAVKSGKRWRTTLGIINPDEAVPRLQISPFLRSEL